MAKGPSAGQTARGRYIAQASGEGAQAKVEITQQAPLTSIAATAPTPSPHFTGRRYHLDTLKSVLTAGQTTTPTALQGMGGIGKTATALKLAAELAETFPGGVFWGPLPDHQGNPWPILWAWGRTCGQDLRNEQDPKEQDLNVLANLVRGLLAARQVEQGPLLVIVDDVRREWLEAAQVLQRALPANAPLLLTTRDETLAAALGANIHRLDTLPPTEALTLLQTLAGKAVIRAELPAAQALLEAIGYLPLAIELAGKRLALLARKPGYRLEIFYQAVKQRTAEVLSLPGHPGLAATFALTYDDLSAETQRLFRWLGIFALSPLRLGSVAEVLQLSEVETETRLDELESPALLAWGETAGTYTLHPLLWQYAQSLLAEAGETDKATQRHRAFYVNCANELLKVPIDQENEHRFNDALADVIPNLQLAKGLGEPLRDSKEARLENKKLTFQDQFNLQYLTLQYKLQLENLILRLRGKQIEFKHSCAKLIINQIR